MIDLPQPVDPPSEDVRLVVERFDHHAFPGAIQITFATVIMSIGPDGLDYLDEHAPEWRRHVGMTRVEVSHLVDQRTMASPPQDLEHWIKLVTADVGRRLGARLAEQAAEMALSVEHFDGRSG